MLGLGNNITSKINASNFGAVLWTPSQLTTALWLDADDSDSITESSGAVSQWNDLSGNSKHMTQSGTDKPVTNSHTLNSKNVIFFDFQDWMQAGSIGDWNFLHEANGNSVFIVMKLLDLTNTGPRVLSTYSTNGIIYRMQNVASGGNWGIFHSVNSSTAKSAYIADGIEEGGSASIMSLLHGTSLTNDYNFYVDGTKFYDLDYDNTPADGHDSDVLKLGYDYTLDEVQMDIAEVVICNSALSDTDRQKTEGYLAHKWGLEGSLPIGHPYKSSAPTV